MAENVTPGNLQQTPRFRSVERIALGPFTLEIREEEPRADDAYTSPRSSLTLTNGDKTVDLIELLPPAPHRSYRTRYGGKRQQYPPFYFVNIGTWRHEPHQGSIMFDKDELKKQPERIFLLLHEMGHAVSRERNDDAYHDHVQDSKESGGETGKEHLKEERYAWAQAFKLARTLRDVHGINLFQLFPNKFALMGFVRAEGLHSYEFNYSDQYDPETEDDTTNYTKPATVERYRQWKPDTTGSED